MRTLLPTLVLLWLQLYWALVPTWRFGDYYAFGWFVPVLAAALAWRRWQLLVPGPPPTPPVRVAGWVVALGLGGVVLSIPLQWIAAADPTWRPPLLLLALLTAGLTQVLVWQAYGRRIAVGMLPVMVVALAAVPYPWQFEQHLIRSLTGTVVGLTRELLLLTGQPVELLGERLSMGTEAVDVSDGCSGIRSLQSLVMGALFFGELLLLPLGKRLLLIGIAGTCAIGVNSGRAYGLAAIHFGRGKEAAAAAHDLLGHAAYWLSIAIVFLAACGLVRSTTAGRQVVRRSHTAPDRSINAETLK